jgi:WD40 repeat protein
MPSARRPAALGLASCVAACLALPIGLAAGAEPRRPVALDRLGDPLPAGAIARLGSLRLQHGKNLRGAAFSPDGRILATVSDNRSVRLWDTNSGGLRGRLDGHAGEINGLAFSPDGKYLTSGDDTGFRLWDLANHSVRFSWALEGAAGVEAAFSPDSRLVAAAYAGQPLVLYDVATGKGVRQVRVPPGKSFLLAFSPDSKHLAVACKDKVLRVYDVASGKKVRTYEGSETTLNALAWSPGGKMIASADGGKVRLWEAATEEMLRELPDQEANVVALRFDGAGKHLTTLNAQGVSIFWEAATGKLVRSLGEAQEERNCLALSPDGSRWAAGGKSGDVHIGDVATGKEKGRAERLPQAVLHMAFQADGRTAVLVCGDGTVVVWDVATGRELRRLRTWPEPMGEMGHWGLTLAPQGSAVAWANEEGRIHVWNVARGKETRSWPTEKLILTLAFSPDGRTLASAGKDEKVMRVWDPATGKERFSLDSPEEGVTLLTFSPDGRSLAGLGGDGTVRIWELAPRRERARWPVKGVTSLLFSPGCCLVAGDGAGVVSIYRPASGKVLHRVASHEDTVWAIAFSPDGRLLATGSEDQTIRLWDVATGRELATLAGHEGGVKALAFSPDGRRLISGSDDLTALTWDLAAALRPTPAAGAGLTPEQLKTLWDDLGEADAARAYTALGRLVNEPTRSVPFLADHLRPVAPVDERRLARLIADLDSEDGATRTRATNDLAALEELAEPALRRALAGKPSPELRRRAEELLEKVEQPPSEPGRLRPMRAVEALEMIGTPEAVKVLHTLASGAAPARLTRESAAALARLSRRQAAPQ